ncbi:hypothetical protein [Halobacterium wangiae]|uniref:hypothetical protein n=1 Tax=Halobacterium wangiae TaxID=2902623 RepID=UPI001E34BBCA|nr:hypothetical protein [Halobacterium wangiae]
MNRRLGVVVVAVVVHLALTLGHGWAHASIPVPFADWQGVYVGVVLVLAPSTGVLAVASERHKLGAGLLVAAGVGGVAFEGLFHFVVHGPDHVATVERGTKLFASTAVLTTVGDALLVVAGSWLYRSLARRDDRTGDRRSRARHSGR